jgi:hypothetical protein
MPTTPGKEVVFEIVVYLPDEEIEHVERCEAPLYCALGLHSNAVTVVAVERDPSGNGNLMTIPFSGCIIRTRVNDAAWIKATSDTKAQIAALTTPGDEKR